MLNKPVLGTALFYNGIDIMRFRKQFAPSLHTSIVIWRPGLMTDAVRSAISRAESLERMVGVCRAGNDSAGYILSGYHGKAQE